MFGPRRSWIFLIILWIALFGSYLPAKRSYTLIVKNGFILDGSGSRAFKADIGIKGQRISHIGSIAENQAQNVIDAQGLVVSPGFIDVHTHCDRGIVRIPTADNYTRQGVTTVIGGNCGGHPLPLRDLFQKIEEKGIALNFGSLVGHNTVREEVMGFKMGDPTADEMARMKKLVEEEMKAGALGFSTGLSYLPGTYAKTEEVVELAFVAARFGGIYTTHLRDQGLHITEAIQEAIEVGERNKMPVQISHIKLTEEPVWNELERITGPVEAAQKRGVAVALDQYPYAAASTGFGSSFPSWCFEGGREKFLERLKDQDTYEKVKSYIIAKRLTSTKGIDKLKTIYIARCRAYPHWEGKNLEEILVLQGKRPDAANAADLIIEIEKTGGASAIFFVMDEKDVEALMKLPYLMIGSDGDIQEVGQGMPHPRSYGTFPRVIGRYVREKGIITLEEAVRKMTSLPARTFKIKDRGQIKEGFFADITIFDPASFIDSASFAEPRKYSQGLSAVVVNGEIVFEHSEPANKLPGMIIYGEGKAR